MDPDQIRHSVGSDQDPDCLQKVLSSAHIYTRITKSSLVKTNLNDIPLTTTKYSLKVNFHYF